MKIRNVMTRQVEYVASDTTLDQAAQKMRELDCGFLPIGNSNEDKLHGVVTDRDMVIRALAEGLDPSRTTVEQIKSDKVLYCYENDDIQSAADSMGEQRVYRLIVLDNERDKRLCGIVTLGDILRHNQQRVAERAARDITAKAA